MIYTEALLLVDYHQSQIAEFETLSADTVGADQYIYAAGRKFADDLELLLRSTETAYGVYGERILFETLLKTPWMLFSVP
jgi:hypothetical protein